MKDRMRSWVYCVCVYVCVQAVLVFYVVPLAQRLGLIYTVDDIILPPCTVALSPVDEDRTAEEESAPGDSSGGSLALVAVVAAHEAPDATGDGGSIQSSVARAAHADNGGTIAPHATSAPSEAAGDPASIAAARDSASPAGTGWDASDAASRARHADAAAEGGGGIDIDPDAHLTAALARLDSVSPRKALRDGFWADARCAVAEASARGHVGAGGDARGPEIASAEASTSRDGGDRGGGGALTIDVALTPDMNVESRRSDARGLGGRAPWSPAGVAVPRTMTPARIDSARASRGRRPIATLEQARIAIAESSPSPPRGGTPHFRATPGVREENIGSEPRYGVHTAPVPVDQASVMWAQLARNQKPAHPALQRVALLGGGRHALQREDGAEEPSPIGRWPTFNDIAAAAADGWQPPRDAPNSLMGGPLEDDYGVDNRTSPVQLSPRAPPTPSTGGITPSGTASAPNAPASGGVLATTDRVQRRWQADLSDGVEGTPAVDRSRRAVEVRSAHRNIALFSSPSVGAGPEFAPVRASESVALPVATPMYDSPLRGALRRAGMPGDDRASSTSPVFTGRGASPPAAPAGALDGSPAPSVASSLAEVTTADGVAAVSGPVRDDKASAKSVPLHNPAGEVAEDKRTGGPRFRRRVASPHRMAQQAQHSVDSGGGGGGGGVGGGSRGGCGADMEPMNGSRSNGLVHHGPVTAQKPFVLASAGARISLSSSPTGLPSDAVSATAGPLDRSRAPRRGRSPSTAARPAVPPLLGSCPEAAGPVADESVRGVFVGDQAGAWRSADGGAKVSEASAEVHGVDERVRRTSVLLHCELGTMVRMCAHVRAVSQ